MCCVYSSAGLSASVTTPSVSQLSPDLHKSFIEEAKSSDTETIKHSSSSIIGLRAAAAATFETNKIKVDESPVEEANGLKPRPPPKPRPWSIVGVDRKSGEFTQVETASPGEAEREEEHRSGSLSQSAAGRGSVRDIIANLNKPDSPGKSSVSSVRERIANMNKNAESDPSKRKGNSLPRSTEVPVSKSPGTRQKNSPINRKKDSTSDDPRILKLDDDFLFEDTVNV